MMLKLYTTQKYLASGFLLAILLSLWTTSHVCAQTKKIDSLTQVLKTHPQQDDVRAVMLFNLTVELLQHDLNAALNAANEMISFQNRIKDRRAVSGIYRVSGIIHLYSGRYTEALESLNKALIVDTSIKHNYGVAGDLSNMGLVYMTQSRYLEALQYYLKALKSFEMPVQEVDYALTSGNIGTVYNEMGDLKEAIKHYQKALIIHKRTKNYKGQIATLINFGIISYKKKDYKEAIQYGDMALKLADSTGDFRSSAMQNGNLSAYYSRLNQPDVALRYGLKAIEMNKKIANQKGIGANMQNVSEAYFKLGNYALAKAYGYNSLKIGNEFNITEIKRDASLGLSEIYQILNKPDSALFFYKKHAALIDTISNDEKKNEITRMGIQFDFDKKELSYQQKQELADQQIKQQQLQLALNNAEIQQGLQLRDLQKISLQNEKLINTEKEKQLIIAKNNEKLQANKVSALSQQQKLNKLRLNQLWLYGILMVVVLTSILLYILNLNRIRRLRFRNSLQIQQAQQEQLRLQHQYQLSESELKALRAQMNPHFIFNVLNSIEAYIMENEKRVASRLIQKFAALSRLILENSTKRLVTADKEWKALILYTELQAMRYTDKFTHQFEVCDSLQLSMLYLPPMLIQPLIENAILHGLIEDEQTKGHLCVTLKPNESGICITVEDNGVGFKPGKKSNQITGVKEQSIGLSSIRERIGMINQQNPEFKASFSVMPAPHRKGTIATVCLPTFLMP